MELDYGKQELRKFYNLFLPITDTPSKITKISDISSYQSQMMLAYITRRNSYMFGKHGSKAENLRSINIYIRSLV